MASDYEAIRRDHREHYGTKVRRWVKRLLVDRYDDRSHFIYELLQNAEDALGARTAASLPSGVHFYLDEQSLRIRHYGRPFDDRDVRSICAIAESTKDETAIGHFGVGFKSVFTITDSPEIHSGAEDFRIEDFVCPYPAGPVERDHDETVFVCPLRNRADAAEVERGLRRLGADALRFLQHIDSVEWTVRGRSSGTYIRQNEILHHSHPGVRRATSLGEAPGEPATEQTFLVFSRPLSLDSGIERFVEIAFCLEGDRIVPVAHSPLVVFFPTVLETNLGFVLQGPYRTTLSRDNVSRRILGTYGVSRRRRPFSSRPCSGCATATCWMSPRFAAYPSPPPGSAAAACSPRCSRRPGMRCSAAACCPLPTALSPLLPTSGSPGRTPSVSCSTGSSWLVFSAATVLSRG